MLGDAGWGSRCDADGENVASTGERRDLLFLDPRETVPRDVRDVRISDPEEVREKLGRREMCGEGERARETRAVCEINGCSWRDVEPVRFRELVSGGVSVDEYDDVRMLRGVCVVCGDDVVKVVVCGVCGGVMCMVVCDIVCDDVCSDVCDDVSDGDVCDDVSDGDVCNDVCNDVCDDVCNVCEGGIGLDISEHSFADVGRAGRSDCGGCVNWEWYLSFSLFLGSLRFRFAWFVRAPGGLG